MAEQDGVDMGTVGNRRLCVGGVELAVDRDAAAAFPTGAGVGGGGRGRFLCWGSRVLHATLITLMGYTEGLYAGGSDLRQQARILGKSVLWATTVLGVAYGLQAPWTISSLICGTGLLNFVVLLTWRWQNGRKRGASHPGAARNVLIVGAGGMGRRVASFIDEHPEAGRKVYGFLDNERPSSDRVIGRVSDLARLARTGFVDEVILAAPRDRELDAARARRGATAAAGRGNGSGVIRLHTRGDGS